MNEKVQLRIQFILYLKLDLNQQRCLILCTVLSFNWKYLNIPCCFLNRELNVKQINPSFIVIFSAGCEKEYTIHWST